MPFICHETSSPQCFAKISLGGDLIFSVDLKKLIFFIHSHKKFGMGWMFPLFIRSNPLPRPG
jgi:hypothetical protein